MAELALALDTDRITYLTDKARIHILQGDDRLAISVINQIPEDKRKWAHLEKQARALTNLRDFSAAIETIEQAREISNRHPWTLISTARILARMGGRETEARALIQEVRTLMENGIYFPEAKFAEVYYYLGEKEKALRSLEKGFEQKGTWQMLELRFPRYLRLFSDELRYWTLVEKMKFPPLPAEDPFYDREQEMRFAKGGSSISTFSIESKKSIRKIAVLPFTSISSEENQAWFADAVTQTLTTQLGKIQALSVTAHTSASQFKGSDDTVLEISRSLNVDALIEGSIIRIGDQVQITANLVNGLSGESQWGDIFVDSVDDLLSLQGKVALEIAKSVSVTITPENTSALAGRHAVSRKAFEYYLQGVAQKGYSEESGKRTLRFAELAIEEDPNFGSAYILKARTLMELLYWGFARGDEPIDQTKAALAQALFIDPQLPEALGLAGQIAFFVDRDFALAERQMVQAVKAVPNDAELHRTYSDLLGISQRHSESIKHARRAQELDPLNARVAHSLSWAHFRNGDYGRALEAAEEVIRLDAGSFAGYHNKAFTLVGKGQAAEAEKYLRLAYVKSGEAPFFLARMGYALGVLGHKEEATRLLQQLEGIVEVEPGEVKAHHFGLLYLGMGNDVKAIEWFERALEDGDMAVVYLGSNFYWDADRKPLRDNPKYQRLLRRIGLPE